jgi:hypothetical protein
MAGSENYTFSSYYPWGNMQGASKLEATRPTFDGMFSTLAPSALENSDDFSTTPSKSAEGSNDNTTAPSAGLEFNFSQDNSNSKGISGFGSSLTRESSANGLGSGQITPGEGFWDSFVQDGGWTEETTAK